MKRFVEAPIGDFDQDGRPWHIYVLSCEHDFYYVGIAQDIPSRFDAHITGTGAQFTRDHKPVRVYATYCCHTCSKEVAYNFENQATVIFAKQFGPAKVKGGRYFSHRKLARKVNFLDKNGGWDELKLPIQGLCPRCAQQIGSRSRENC